MQTASRILRLIALAILSGGSSAIVFAAIVLVKAAVAQGTPVSEAATANAPIFIQYARVAAGAGAALAVAELIAYLSSQNKSKLDYLRYLASLGCLISVCTYSFGIVPQMEQLLPDIKTVQEAHEQFHRLHEISRAVFGAGILAAFLSLLLPSFRKEVAAGSVQSPERQQSLVS